MLNNKIYTDYKRKQFEFNQPSHLKGQPMIIQYIQIFVDFYILLLSAPLRRFPRLQSERIFIGTVCLLSLNIVSLFQSSLANVFINPMFFKNIDDLQQFAETCQRILIKHPAMLTDLFPEDSSDLFRTLHDRMVLVPRPELTAISVTNQMEMATVTRKITSRLLDEGNFVHLIPECPRSYNLAYLLSKRSVFLDPVNAIILDINRFGFINKWIDEINFKAKLESIKRNPPNSNHARVLNISDMQLSFIILLFGSGLAFVLFVIECFTKSKHKQPVLIFIN